MPISASLFTAVKISSITSTSSSTFILPTSYVPSHDVGNVSLDEQGRILRESVQLCKTNVTLMWPVVTRNGTHFHPTDSTVYNLNTISAKTLQWITINVRENGPSREANSCSATHLIPRLLQNTWVHYYFHHSLTHTLSPNSFSPPIFCSHTYSSLNNITITAHMFSALQTTCWHTKMMDKKVRHWQMMEPLT